MAYRQKPYSGFVQRTEENTPIVKKNLGKNINAEAGNDGKIYIDNNIKKGTTAYKKAVKHELVHMNQMESGRADYDDNNVIWEGKKYPRKNGKVLFNGAWHEEGDHDLPWEAEAVKAENK